jgi:superfamily II DNA or RNA helicase
MAKSVKISIKKGVHTGNRVYVPTPDHGFVEAEVVNVKHKNNKVNVVTLRYIDEFIKEIYGSDDVVYMESNVNKIVPKGDESARPLHWMRSNRKEFPDWVTKNFIKYNTCSKNYTDDKIFKGTISCKLSSYQAFVRDYLGHNSPFRSLLLYHRLGGGKTVSSVSVSENLKDTRNVVVMLPASLKGNFITDGLVKCGDPLYKKDVGKNLIMDKYSFVSYNASNLIAQVDNLGSLDNKVIVIDEAHNLGTMMANGFSGMGKQGREIYKRLLEAKNCKIIALSGTPLVNTPFELALLFNVLRGLLEVVIFRVRNFQEETIDNYLADVIKDDRVGYVDLNRRNQSLQVILKVKSWDMEFEQTVRFLEKKGKEYGAIIDFTKVDKYTLFPEDEEMFNDFFVKEGLFVNKTTFQRRILGLVSYYKGTADKDTDYPTLLPEEIIKVEMSPHQFEIYEMARQEERKKERMAAYQKKQRTSKMESKVPTLARVFSREFSNFVFPDNILRPFKAIQFISVAQKKEKNEEIEKKLIHGEITEEEAKKLLKPVLSDEQWEIQLNKALTNVSKPDKPYLKPGKDGLERYSPKMLEMLKEINKNKKGLILVYSAFRKVEGLEIFARVLEANGFKRYLSGDKISNNDDYMRFTFYSGQEKMDNREKIKKIFTSSDNKEGKDIRILLTSSAGTEGLDLKNIRKVMIMEPYWHEVRIKQIIGRAVRQKSHFDLPEEDRNVKVYRYISVLTDKQKTLTTEKQTTDEYVMDQAKKKEELNRDVLTAVQEASADCILNQCINDMKGKCFKFAGDKQGLSYLPDLTRDIVFGYEQTKTRTIKRKVLVAGLTKDNEVVYKKSKDGPWYLANDKKLSKKPKLVKGKKFAFDPVERKVFDYNNFKETGNLIDVGKINQDGKLIPI